MFWIRAVEFYYWGKYVQVRGGRNWVFLGKRRETYEIEWTVMAMLGGMEGRLQGKFVALGNSKGGEAILLLSEKYYGRRRWGGWGMVGGSLLLRFKRARLRELKQGRIRLLLDRASLWELENKNQLDSTYYFIVLLIGSTCFGHCYAHHQELATIMLITTLVVSFLVSCRLEVSCG